MTAMSSRSSHLLHALAVVSFVAVVVPTGIMLWRRAFEPLPEHGLEVLRLVHHQVLEDYVEAEDPDELLTKAVQGMVSNLDRYSEFVVPEEVEEFEGRELEGTYVGIGVLLFGRFSPITVQAPLPGGPAEAAGLLPGDRILAVDGEDISTLPAEEAVDTALRLLKGPVGSAVELRIGRGEDTELAVEVARAEVVESRVKWAHLVDPGQRLGYVYVSGFQRDVTGAFDSAIESLELEAGGALRGLVLDLRHDPGGLLEEAIALVNRFLESGEIVSLKRRGEVVVERHFAEPERCTLPDLPLVVLIDGKTASASEVVTGALQDHGRARIVGVRSYGKGVVQSIYSWRNRDFRLKLTTSHYYTPNGRSIEKTLRREGDGEAEGGIAPDVDVPLDPQTQQRVLWRLTRKEVSPEWLEAARVAAEEIGRELAAPLTPEEDPQLQTALDELRSLVKVREEGR